MNRTDRLTIAMCVAAIVAVILMGASQYANAQVPIYTRPSANISGTSPTGVTFDASDVFQAEDSITAFATGGQASATALSATKSYHRVTTVVTPADSVKLPAATVGQEHYVRNDGAAAMQVYGQATETINGVASATGISQGVGMGVWYVCTTAGAWTTSPVSTITATTGFIAPTGASGTPSYSFNGASTTGLFNNSGFLGIVGASGVSFYTSTTYRAALTPAGFGLRSDGIYGWASGTDPSAAADTVLARDAANTLAQKNGTNAQTRRLYFSTTGPVYFQETARTAGTLFTGVGGAMQLSTAQTTSPTCTTNCGTPGNVVAGTDSAGTITMGTTPASGFVMVFNGTWPAAPKCSVWMSKAGMATGKKPITTVATTGQITVTTDGTAPIAADTYDYICLGAS